MASSSSLRIRHRPLKGVGWEGESAPSELLQAGGADPRRVGCLWQAARRQRAERMAVALCTERRACSRSLWSLLFLRVLRPAEGAHDGGAAGVVVVVVVVVVALLLLLLSWSLLCAAAEVVASSLAGGIVASLVWVVRSNESAAPRSAGGAAAARRRP